MRVPSPPPAPPEADAHPTEPVARAALLAARGEVAAAESAWKSGAANTELLAQRCLVEGVLRDYDALVDACASLLDAAPGDARAIGALRVLVKAKVARRAASDVVADRGARWVASCAKAKSAAGCADLAVLAAEESMENAAIRKDRARYDAAIAASGRLRRGHVEGPFEGDPRVVAARDVKGESLSPRAPFFRSRSFLDEDGEHEPSLRGVDGLYRIRFGAEGRGPATVYVTGSHFVRVRVDGAVVAERPMDAPSPTTVRAGLVLAPGKHVVELLAWSSGRGDRITAAFLDESGRPALAEIKDVPARGAGASPASATGAVEALAAPSSGAGDVDALFRTLWRQVIARAPSFGVDPDEGRQIAAILSGRYGWSPLALAVAAEQVSEDKSVPERVSSSSAAALWSRVREVWPNHPVARIAEARNLKEERPDEALAAYRALVAAQPRYPFGHRELIDVALDDGSRRRGTRVRGRAPRDRSVDREHRRRSPRASRERRLPRRGALGGGARAARRLVCEHAHRPPRARGRSPR